MSSVPVITVHHLSAAGVCKRWREKLHRMFGAEIPVTLDVCVDHAEDIDWDDATHLLEQPYRHEYLWDCAAALQEHELAEVAAYNALKDEERRLSGIADMVRKMAPSLDPLAFQTQTAGILRVRKKLHDLAAYLYTIGYRAAASEFRKTAAVSIMRYNLTVAKSFCKAYSAQWAIYK